MNWTKTEDSVYQELNDGALLVNARTGVKLWLNNTSAALWKLCDGSRSTRELAIAFSQISGRGMRQAQHDASKFCAGIQTLGLLNSEPKLALASMPVNTAFSSDMSAPTFRILARALAHGAALRRAESAVPRDRHD